MSSALKKKTMKPDIRHGPSSMYTSSIAISPLKPMPLSPSKTICKLKTKLKAKQKSPF